MGKLDPKGRLILSGRAKDVVVSSSGENIYLDDVEQLIGSIKGIKEYVRKFKRKWKRKIGNVARVRRHIPV